MPLAPPVLFLTRPCGLHLRTVFRFSQVYRIVLERMDTCAAALPGSLPFPEVAAGVEYFHVKRLPSPQQQEQRGRCQRQACRFRHGRQWTRGG